jgi:hypothetical protein
MPFATNKSPEQLIKEKKEKMGKFADKSHVCLARLSKMRGLDPVLKAHIINDLLPDIAGLRDAVSK